GQPVVGVLYDGINKKVPKRPSVLKNGRLSVEWKDEVTALSFAAACQDADIKIDEDEKYREFYRRLCERDKATQTPFFTRHEIRMSEHQLDQWQTDTWQVLAEIASDPAIYPNF